VLSVNSSSCQAPKKDLSSRRTIFLNTFYSPRRGGGGEKGTPFKSCPAIIMRREKGYLAQLVDGSRLFVFPKAGGKRRLNLMRCPRGGGGKCSSSLFMNREEERGEKGPLQKRGKEERALSKAIRIRVCHHFYKGKVYFLHLGDPGKTE